MPLRFHLDEHIHAAIAVGLRAHGINVSTTVEANMSGAEDIAHVAFARDEVRVIITHDEDYLRLHARGIPHAGIGYCHQEKYSIGRLLQMLILLDACYTTNEMLGRVEYL